MYKPVDNFFKLCRAADFFVKDLGEVLHDGPEDVTLCMFSSASSPLR